MSMCGFVWELMINPSHHPNLCVAALDSCLTLISKLLTELSWKTAILFRHVIDAMF